MRTTTIPLLILLASCGGLKSYGDSSLDATDTGVDVVDTDVGTTDDGTDDSPADTDTPDDTDPADTDGGTAGEVKVLADLSPGDLVITELMVDPDDNSTCGDRDGEYIEFRNQSGDAVDLIGLRIHDSNSSWTVANHVIAQDGEWVLATIEPTTVACYGLNPQLQYTQGITLASTGGIVRLDHVVPSTGTPMEYDSVTYPSLALAAVGVSLNLDATHLSATANDDAANWCASVALIAGHADRGTPGLANETCGAGGPGGPTDTKDTAPTGGPGGPGPGPGPGGPGGPGPGGVDTYVPDTDPPPDTDIGGGPGPGPGPGGVGDTGWSPGGTGI